MDLPHLLSTPRARKLYISNERHVVSLQSTDFFFLRRSSQIFSPNLSKVEENTTYSNIQKIKQFALYVWITGLRVNEDEG